MVGYAFSSVDVVFLKSAFGSVKVFNFFAIFSSTSIGLTEILASLVGILRHSAPFFGLILWRINAFWTLMGDRRSSPEPSGSGVPESLCRRSILKLRLWHRSGRGSGPRRAGIFEGSPGPIPGSGCRTSGASHTPTPTSPLHQQRAGTERCGTRIAGQDRSRPGSMPLQHRL
jgi:hypothetical protein